MVSRIDFGRPGRLKSRHDPRIPAVCLDRIAVGVYLSEIARICSPNPGINRSTTFSVAYGVTSRSAGPVPPVVTTTLQPTMSASSIIVDSIKDCLSGMHR